MFHALNIKILKESKLYQFLSENLNRYSDLEICTCLFLSTTFRSNIDANKKGVPYKTERKEWRMKKDNGETKKKKKKKKLKSIKDKQG